MGDPMRPRWNRTRGISPEPENSETMANNHEDMGAHEGDLHIDEGESRVLLTAHSAADSTMPPARATSDETSAIYRLKLTEAARSGRVSTSPQ